MQTRTAELLGIGERHLRHKLKKYELNQWQAGTQCLMTVETIWSNLRRNSRN